MFAPASAAAIALFESLSRWLPCWALTEERTAALPRPRVATIAKIAVGSAIPRSLRRRSRISRMKRSIASIAVPIGYCRPELEPIGASSFFNWTPALVSCGCELLDAARALAARRQHQFEVVGVGGELEGDGLGDLALHHVVHQGLVEGAHAVVLALGDDFGDLAGLLRVHDQVLDAA